MCNHEGETACATKQIWRARIEWACCAHRKGTQMGEVASEYRSLSSGGAAKLQSPSMAQVENHWHTGHSSTSKLTRARKSKSITDGRWALMPAYITPSLFRVEKVLQRRCGVSAAPHHLECLFCISTRLSQRRCATKPPLRETRTSNSNPRGATARTTAAAGLALRIRSGSVLLVAHTTARRATPSP